MTFHNIMTCGGWVDGIKFLGPCSQAWFGLVVVIFICFILRKQCEDGILAGTGFNSLGAFGLGIGANLVVTSVIGSARWSLLAGVLGIIIGGYVIGLILGSGGEQ